jgi:CheY-like chemotaxis protein
MNDKRILIIEDELLVAMELQSILQEAGAREVEIALTEVEALTLLDQGVWHAVVADANLHGRSNRTVAKVMRQRQIPFVTVTGYGRESLPPELADVPFLSKPVIPSRLVQTITGLFGS